MEIVLNATQLSDLFFNYEKPLLATALESSAMSKSKKSNEDVDAALQEEAENFSTLLDGQVSTEWLVEDFKARL